jgi:hypothetical protein
MRSQTLGGSGIGSARNSVVSGQGYYATLIGERRIGGHVIQQIHAQQLSVAPFHVYSRMSSHNLRTNLQMKLVEGTTCKEREGDSFGATDIEV